MAIIPRWARAKVRTANRRRKSSLAARADEVSPLMQNREAFAYRNRVLSNGKIVPSSTYEGGLIRVFDKVLPEPKWHGYPIELVSFLSCFDNTPDDQLPPLVAVTRRRAKEWQSTIKGQGKTRTLCLTVSVNSFRLIFCLLSGQQAYFIWLSRLKNKAMKSTDLTADYARLVMMTHQSNPQFKIEDNLTWIETVDYPASAT